MGKIISSIWQTVDGIIDASSMDKWFFPFDSEERGNYINETIHNCEAMLYGRLTYEMLSGYWSQQKNNEFGIADKLNNTRKYLVSKSINDANWGETIIIRDDVIKQVNKIKAATNGNILIQGSASVVNILLKENLVDTLKLLVHPFIAGNGKKLFDEMNEFHKTLQLARCDVIGKGVTLLEYELSV